MNITIYCRIRPMSEVEQVEFACLLAEGRVAAAFEYLHDFIEVSMKPFDDGPQAAGGVVTGAGMPIIGEPGPEIFTVPCPTCKRPMAFTEPAGVMGVRCATCNKTMRVAFGEFGPELLIPDAGCSDGR